MESSLRNSNNDRARLDWQSLDRLRDIFINRAAAAPYWRTPADLANYDLSYAERIGWKWDAVLSELRRRVWSPPPQTRALLDWGCGSGVASRRILRAFGPGAFDTLLLWDRSPLARDYAAQAARRTFPNLHVEALASTPADSAFGAPDSGFALVVSHVINELSTPALDGLLALARRAGAVFWAEPGTHADSRALVAVREQLRASHDIIAPCAHAAPCGLLAPGNERHWCHAFAAPPRNIHADSDWVKFGRRAGIDLRSLPYSFLVLQKKPPAPVAPAQAAALPLARSPVPVETAGADCARQAALPAPPPPLSRLLGRPRLYKAHAALCNCDAGGVRDLTLHKRDAPALFKTLERSPAHPPLYLWERDPFAPAKILGGRPFLPLAPASDGAAAANQKCALGEPGRGQDSG